MVALDLTTKAKKNISVDGPAMISNVVLKAMPLNVINTCSQVATDDSLINSAVGDCLSIIVQYQKTKYLKLLKNLPGSAIREKYQGLKTFN